MKKLTHVDQNGKARMVDVGKKGVTHRHASASARVTMSPETLEAIRENKIKKGDVLAVARIAGIMAAKKVYDLIPLTHPLQIEHVSVDFEFLKSAILVKTEASIEAKTGVEMEALAAAAIAALTIYDMAKAMDRGMEITDVRLESKSGGRSGDYRRTKKSA